MTCLTSNCCAATLINVRISTIQRLTTTAAASWMPKNMVAYLDRVFSTGPGDSKS